MADPNKTRAAIDPIVPIAVAAGFALGFITDAASKSDIGAGTWTLKGNGAIAVLFAGAGALLTFGWLALAYGARGERGYLNRALGGAAATCLLELAFIFAPTALGAQATPMTATILVVVSLAAALAVGAVLASGEGLVAGTTVAILALAASLAPLGLQFFLVPLFLPLIVATPSLARTADGWLVLNSVALLVALVVGLYAAQALANR